MTPGPDQSTDSQVPDPPAGSGPWYQGGLGFKCTSCGNCCTGPPGAVWFDRRESEEMARALDLDRGTFLRKYARRINGRMSLRERHTRHGYDCVFLDRETVPGKAVCRIYAERPSQCRTWPFWSENLSSPEDWERAREQTPCPGMGCTDPWRRSSSDWSSHERPTAAVRRPISDRVIVPSIIPSRVARSRGPLRGRPP